MPPRVAVSLDVWQPLAQRRPRRVPEAATAGRGHVAWMAPEGGWDVDEMGDLPWEISPGCP